MFNTSSSMEQSNRFIEEFTILMPVINHVVLASYDFNNKHYDNRLYQQFNIDFPTAIQHSVLKRQAGYLAGRYAASFALKNLGIADTNIASGKHRNPIWPPSISASITHTDNRAICAASYKNKYKYLGIDLEKKLNLKCITDIKNSIINLQEEKTLLTSNLSFEDSFSLTFSAKESLFKALYPSIREYFDFSAAVITNICCHENTFTIALLEDLTTDLVAGKKFTGHFIFDEKDIFTLIAQ